MLVGRIGLVRWVPKRLRRVKDEEKRTEEDSERKKNNNFAVMSAS